MRAWAGWGKRNVICLCYPLRDSTNRFFKLPQATTEAIERTRNNTEEALRTNVSDQCEVLAKCEQNLNREQKKH